MEYRILEELQTYLGQDAEDDKMATLEFCAKRAVSSFKAKRGYPSEVSEIKIAEDMERFYYCIYDLALFYFVKQGAEFESLHIENAVHRTYQTEAEIYLTHGVFPLVRVF